MTYTVEQLIKNPVKRPVRRVYIKRRDSVTGDYETNWFRIDKKDGVNKIINHGTVNFKVDADKIVPNSFAIDIYNLKAMNSDGYFNSSTDYRSILSGYRDWKDVKIKIQIAMQDPDLIEVGTLTVFEGVVQSVDSGGDNTAAIKTASYAKKLNEYFFGELAISGTRTVSYILAAIFADTRVLDFFPALNVTLDPVSDATIDCDANEDLKGTFWDAIKYLAVFSNSTVSVVNDTFYFGTREVVGTTAVFTFAGLGNTQDDRAITIYGKPTFDQAGNDKLYTNVIDQSSNLVGDNTWIDPATMNEGKTLKLDLKDLTSNAEKQDLLDSYVVRFGVRRPSLKFSAPFMMFTLFPLDIIAVDSPGSKTEVNSGYYDSSLYDDGSVYDGDGSSAAISADMRFVIESITYDVEKWESQIFCRKLV
jgi:hypothetical protein